MAFLPQVQSFWGKSTASRACCPDPPFGRECSASLTEDKDTQNWSVFPVRRPPSSGTPHWNEGFGWDDTHAVWPFYRRSERRGSVRGSGIGRLERIMTADTFFPSGISPSTRNSLPNQTAAV